MSMPLPLMSDSVNTPYEPSSNQEHGAAPIQQQQQQQQRMLLLPLVLQQSHCRTSPADYGSTTTTTPSTSHNEQPRQQQQSDSGRGPHLLSHKNKNNSNDNSLGGKGNYNNDDEDYNNGEEEEEDDDDLWLLEYSQYSMSDFTLPVDAHRGYRATHLEFCSWDRPHMRAFHASWILYFWNFVLQFSMAPLLLPISQSLHLSKEQIWNSTIWMMMGGIPMRFLLGPLCDQYGARVIMTIVLALCAIPGLASFAIVNGTTLTCMRFILGAMDTFVPGQYWITCHFVRDAVGSTAMAMSGGLGASGSAVAQLILGSLLYPFLMQNVTHESMDVAWRLTIMIPSIIALAISYLFYHHSDDTPLGNMNQIHGIVLDRTSNSAVDSFRRGVFNLNSWILLLQYATCCGVDFTMCNGTALYYHERYPDMTVAVTAAIAGLYSVAALYARASGGLLSDVLSNRHSRLNHDSGSILKSTRGSESSSIGPRLWAHMICLLLQGICNIVLARMDTYSLSWNLIVLVLLSILIQMSMGTCFGIVPYVDSQNTGSVAGVVGAGGNVGAALFAFVFLWFDYKTSMTIMGGCTVVASLLSPFIVIKGFSGICHVATKQGNDEDEHGLHPTKQPSRTVLVQARSPHFTKLRRQQQHQQHHYQRQQQHQ